MGLWIAATLIAFFIKGLCGFANTLVFTSILGFGVNNIAISPVELVLGYPTNVILTWKKRHQLDKKVYLPLAVFVLLGSIPGAFLLKEADTGVIKIVFGIIVVLMGIEMLLRDKSRGTLRQSRMVLALVGMLAGLMCGLFGVGALLAAYVGRMTQTSDEFKANISAVFIVENTFRIFLYMAIGVITFESIRQALLLVPFMLLSLFAGMKSSEILDEKMMKKLVILLLIVSGIALILKNIRG